MPHQGVEHAGPAPAISMRSEVCLLSQVMSTGRRVNYGVWRGGATGNKGCYACDLTDRGPSEGLVGLDADLPISPHISPYLLVGLDADSLPTSLPISPHISSMLVGVQVSRHISPHLPTFRHVSSTIAGGRSLLGRPPRGKAGGGNKERWVANWW